MRNQLQVRSEEGKSLSKSHQASNVMLEYSFQKHCFIKSKWGETRGVKERETLGLIKRQRKDKEE